MWHGVQIVGDGAGSAAGAETQNSIVAGVNAARGSDMNLDVDHDCFDGLAGLSRTR